MQIIKERNLGKARQFIESVEKSLTEATLSRLVQHLNQGDCLAFISAERDENTPQQNTEATKQLRQYASNLARSLKIGYFKAKGGYVEIRDDGSKKNVDGENSIIIFAPSDQFDIVKEFAISMGIKFKQDSIMLVDPNGIAKWIATRPDSSVGSQVGKSELTVGKFNASQIGLYYSKVGKKAFSFAELKEGYQPTTRPTSIQLRGSDYFCKAIKECVEKEVSFYEYFFDEKHRDIITAQA